MTLRPAILSLAALTGLAGPAAAHPHVFVTGSSQIVYDAQGQVSAVSHRWTFDEMFSTMATQGLDTNGDGVFAREELADLARINVDSLGEYAFFTVLEVAGVAAEFAAPTQYWLDHAGGQLTLNFTLPLTTALDPAKGAAEFSVYDPSFFVAFAFDTGKEVALVNAPAGCTAAVTEPQDLDKMQTTTLADAFVLEAGPDANFGAEFAGKITVACP
jgi:ABC-type uncharacterized transport system substrate-binding protein